MSKMLFAMPKIPGAVMDDMYLIVTTGGGHSSENGGQWVGGTPAEQKFSGALLPLSEEDLQQMPQGEYTTNQKKIYTNGFSLADGAEVIASDGHRYTVKRELEYGMLHQMKRYLVERKGAAHK